MKLKRLDEELDFLNSSVIEEVESYIFKHSLRKKTEELLVKKFPQLLTHYIALHGVCQKTASMIIKLDDYETIEVLLASSPKEYNVEALFFNFGNYQTVTKWLATHNSDRYPEKELFWNGSMNDIIRYIQKEQVSEFGQYDLIARKKDLAVIEMIKRHRLSVNNREALMLIGSKTVASNLLEQISLSCPKDQRLLTQIYDIRFNKANIVSTLQKQRLLKQAEDLFFEIGDIELVLDYANRFFLQNIDLNILRRKNRNGIITYLANNKLSQEGEDLLLKTGDFYEIIVYTFYNTLSLEGEIKLIKRGNHNEIMYYLSHHSLADEAQKVLIKRGNHIEILQFVSTYPLTDCAERVLFKRGNDEEIEAYFAKKEASGQLF